MRLHGGWVAIWNGGPGRDPRRSAEIAAIVSEDSSAAAAAKGTCVLPRIRERSPSPESAPEPAPESPSSPTVLKKHKGLFVEAPPVRSTKGAPAPAPAPASNRPRRSSTRNRSTVRYGK